MTDSANTSPEQTPPVARFGRASLITSIIGAVLFCGVSGVGFMAGFTGSRDPFSSSASIMTIANFIRYAGFFLGVIGIALGAMSLARKEKRALGAIGLALGILTACGCLGLFAFGISNAFFR